VPAELDLVAVLDQHPCRAAVADQLAGATQRDREQRMAIARVSLEAPLDPGAGRLPREWLRVVAHRLGVTEHGVQRVQVGEGKVPQREALGSELEWLGHL
jgi:hypothetical protein